MLLESSSSQTHANTRRTNSHQPQQDQLLPARAGGKGLVKLGNFGKNPSKRQYAYTLTPAGLEEKTRITLGFLKRKEMEFEAIR